MSIEFAQKQHPTSDIDTLTHKRTRTQTRRTMGIVHSTRLEEYQAAREREFYSIISYMSEEERSEMIAKWCFVPTENRKLWFERRPAIYTGAEDPLGRSWVRYTKSFVRSYVDTLHRIAVVPQHDR